MRNSRAASGIGFAAHLDALKDLGRVQDSWPHDVLVERDFHDDVLRIGNRESDLKLRSPAL